MRRRYGWLGDPLLHLILVVIFVFCLGAWHLADASGPEDRDPWLAVSASGAVEGVPPG